MFKDRYQFAIIARNLYFIFRDFCIKWLYGLGV